MIGDTRYTPEVLDVAKLGLPTGPGKIDTSPALTHGDASRISMKQLMRRILLIRLPIDRTSSWAAARPASTPL